MVFPDPVDRGGAVGSIISGAVAVPTLSAFMATCWITRSSNQEPWASILLSSTVLAALAGGSVALSLIQRSKVEMIADLARQRTQLLEQLLDWKSLSGRQFPNVCTTVPFSMSWSRAKIWTTCGTA